MNDCTLCPRNCHVDRSKKLGFCMANDKLKIAKADLFYYEEPCISNKYGSGAIFFSNCNLKCIFCQNYDISIKNIGREITIEEFSDICIDLQNKKAININLVTPTIYVPFVIEGIKLAKQKGLKIPIIYNSSGYENVDTIKMLDGYIDIYLPDFKYFNNQIALKYSKVNNYKEVCITAIEEMYKQVGKCKFQNGILKKGIIVRHLMLPNMEDDSKKILKYLYNTYKNNIYISLMNQYTPIKKLKYKELNKTIDEKIYEDIINYAYDLGIRNCFVQEEDSKGKCFIPDFKQK